MTNNGRAAILNPGATPLSYVKLAHKSLSGPLSPRERVRVRAPQRPGRFDHNRTRPNRSSLYRLRPNLPGPSKTNHSQPLCPRKTLGFRSIRPSEKTSSTTVHPRHSKTLPPTFEPRARSRTPSNRAEHARTASPVKTCAQTDKTGPKLSKTDHPQSPIPSKTLEILPVWPRRKILPQTPRVRTILFSRTPPTKQNLEAYPENSTSNEERRR